MFAERIRTVAALAEFEASSVVTNIPGNLTDHAMLVVFDVDVGEHLRRERSGIGAITSAALLTGLWLLPDGVPVLPGQLPEVKVRRFRESPLVVEETEAGFVRNYFPPGKVRAVVFYAGGLNYRGGITELVRRAIQFTPVVQRYALANPKQSVMLDQATVKIAEECGVGIVGTHRSGPAQVLLPAAEAVTGIPSVWRWLAAELAYEQHLDSAVSYPSSRLG